MPIQAPQWTEFLNCPICYKIFTGQDHQPVSLGCGHTVCTTCLAQLNQKKCPFDQSPINRDAAELPINYALLQLTNITLPDKDNDNDMAILKRLGGNACFYQSSRNYIEKLAAYLMPVTVTVSKGGPAVNGNNITTTTSSILSRPMQRKLITLINCQLMEDEGCARVMRSARSLGERTVTELILWHQNPQQLSSNLWAAVRGRGCQFLGPAMQEEVLKLILLALEDGSALSRKVLVLFVVQRLEMQYPQASKTAIGHVVQLLYRASCFKVTKRDEESSLMQLKEEFRIYAALRREHDSQVVQIATEAGLRIAPDQWSSLLYGDAAHKSHMQSIIDKLQTPQSFSQSINELVIALQRSQDPAKLARLRPHLDLLADIDPSPDAPPPSWENLDAVLKAVKTVVDGLVDFINVHSHKQHEQIGAHNMKYKTSMCRDLAHKGSCPRGTSCTFAHSEEEMEKFRARSRKSVHKTSGSQSVTFPGKDSQKKSVNANPSSTTTKEVDVNSVKDVPVNAVKYIPRGSGAENGNPPVTTKPITDLPSPLGITSAPVSDGLYQGSISYSSPSQVDFVHKSLSTNPRMSSFEEHVHERNSYPQNTTPSHPDYKLYDSPSDLPLGASWDSDRYRSPVYNSLLSSSYIGMVSNSRETYYRHGDTQFSLANKVPASQNPSEALELLYSRKKTLLARLDKPNTGTSYQPPGGVPYSQRLPRRSIPINDQSPMMSQTKPYTGMASNTLGTNSNRQTWTSYEDDNPYSHPWSAVDDDALVVKMKRSEEQIYPPNLIHSPQTSVVKSFDVPIDQSEWLSQIASSRCDQSEWLSQITASRSDSPERYSPLSDHGKDENIIPFTDKPRVSRFGPISRVSVKGSSLFKETEPVQVTAPQGRYPTPVTAVTPIQRPFPVVAPVPSRYGTKPPVGLMEYNPYGDKVATEHASEQHMRQEKRRSSKAGVNSVTSTAEREQIKMELKKIDHLIAIKASEDETMTREVQAKPLHPNYDDDDDDDAEIARQLQEMELTPHHALPSRQLQERELTLHHALPSRPPGLPLRPPLITPYQQHIHTNHLNLITRPSNQQGYGDPHTQMYPNNLASGLHQGHVENISGFDVYHEPPYPRGDYARHNQELTDRILAEKLAVDEARHQGLQVINKGVNVAGIYNQFVEGELAPNSG